MEFGEELKEFLLSSIPISSPASGGKFVNCRCFYCPDSLNPTSKHFYISIPQERDDIPWFYCHKCHTTGVLTHKTLIQWGIYEQGIGTELNLYLKNNLNKTKNRKYNSTHYKIINPITSVESPAKLKYISQRIGYDFTYQELADLKIVLNLYDILNYNNITKFTRSPNIVQSLNDYFIGFLSIDNAFLNMRRICREGLLYEGIDKRYINYKLVDKFDTSERFYTIPCRIDLSMPQRVKIHISEGPMDILSIYKNVRKEEPGIYSCISGSNYVGQCIYFLERFKLPLVEFHIYPDNDKFGSNRVMEQVAYTLRFTQAKFFIHRNNSNGEKDFGVPPDRIKETIMKIS